MSERTLDAAELARLKIERIIAGADPDDPCDVFNKKDVRSLIDALEKARGELAKAREELPALWGQYDDEGRPLWISYREQRGLAAWLANRSVAERDAKNALLREVTAVAFPVACDCDECLSNAGLRARIAVELETKP